jgi:6-phosphofructokinase 1
MNASLAGVLRFARREPTIHRVYGARHGILGVLNNDLVDLSGLTEPELDRLARTPGSALGSCRHKVTDAELPAITEQLEELGAGIFLYNGGNDSMDTCLRISRVAPGLRVLGIPKTVDNDLTRTDHSPGYGSAARYYAIRAHELALDVAALNIHVSVLEVMGRNAGWLAASTVLAEDVGGLGPALIYVPEVPFERERFLEDVRRRWDRSQGFVVAVSEGIADRNGTPLVETADSSGADTFGHALPGNVSQYLAELITSELGIRARSEKPGLLGRTSSYYASEIDRGEAYEAGVFAVQSAVYGEATGSMVAMRRISSLPYQFDFELVPLEEVANVEHKLPADYIDDENAWITPAFREYAAPLIGGNFPDYVRL